MVCRKNEKEHLLSDLNKTGSLNTRHQKAKELI